MLLKTYTAPDFATALEQARGELGPAALVLGKTERQSRLGLSIVEITVAAPREVERVADENVRSLAREARRSRQVPQSVRTQARRAGDDPIDRDVERTVGVLVASGLSPDLARRFTLNAAKHRPRRSGADGLAEAAVKGVGELLEFVPLPLLRRCLFVVGPPGAGKTTTVAKLALRARRAARGPVLFAESDADRVGSFEQAEIFCRHIGVDVRRVQDATDLQLALEAAGERGTVLVDTSGIAASDHDRVSELLELRRCVPDAEVAVVLPAGLHRNEAERTLERFRPLEPTCLGFSRVDDSQRPGELVSAVASSRIPLSFFTNGHRIPDLEPATPGGLAAMLLRAGTATEPMEISV